MPIQAILGGIASGLFVLLWLGYVYVLQNDLFYFYHWLDIPLHIMGGLVISLLIGLVYLMRGDIHQQDTFTFRKYFWLVWATMMIGVAWEYYEYIFKLHEVKTGVVLDTLGDLTNDLIGALLGVGIILLLIKLDKRKHRKISRTIKS